MLQQYFAKNHHSVVKMSEEIKTVRNEISDFLKICNDKGNSLLHYVVKSDYKELARQLIVAGCDVNVKNNDGDPPLMLAMDKGQVEMVKILLNSGANHDNTYFRDKEGPLHLAARNGFSEIVELLINLGADVHARNEIGQVALHCAIQNHDDHLKIVKILVNAGADINAVFCRIMTPLLLTVHENWLVGFEFLLSKGADVRRKGNFCFSYLRFAIMNSNMDILNRLIEIGFDFNMKDENGGSCLHVAAFATKLDMIEFLCDKNAVIDVNKYGEDPLCNALSVWHYYYLRLSETSDDHDQDIEKGHVKESYCNQMECLNFLLKYGSNVNHVTTYEMTPLYIVIKHYQKLHSNFVRVLLKNGATFDFEHNLVRDMMNSYRDSKIPHLLLRHTAMFDAQNRTDGPVNFDVNKLNTKSRKDYASCRDELELMKSTKITDTNVSFFNVLVDRDIGPYARNESIISFFEETDVVKRFPNYGDLLCDRFSDAVEHQMLLKKATYGLAHILNWDSKSMILPLSMIVRFLGTKDLTNLANI